MNTYVTVNKICNKKISCNLILLLIFILPNIRWALYIMPGLKKKPESYTTPLTYMYF